MLERPGLRYGVSALAGLAIAALLFSIIRGFVGQHQFQTTRDGGAESNADLVTDFTVPAAGQGRELRAPRRTASLDMPPLPEASLALATLAPPPIPPPELPLPQVAVPFSAMTAPSAVAPAVGANAPIAVGELVLVERVEPKYPPQAAFQGTQGAVTVRFTVEPDGSVRDPVVTDAKPRRGIFDDAALRAVVKWKFKPIPKAMSTSVTLVFNLGQGQ